MRDAEARERLAQLEKRLDDVPRRVASLVIERFQPSIDEVNKTVDAMRNATRGLDGMANVVNELGAKTKENAELLAVLEQEVNAIRVDINAARVAQATVFQQVEAFQDALRTIGNAASRVT